MYMQKRHGLLVYAGHMPVITHSMNVHMLTWKQNSTEIRETIEAKTLHGYYH